MSRVGARQASADVNNSTPGKMYGYMSALRRHGMDEEETQSTKKDGSRLDLER